MALIIIVLLAIVFVYTLLMRHAVHTLRIGLVILPVNAEKIIITSNAFTNGSSIPQLYTCNGINTSIPLSWSNVPSGTKSVIIVMEDLNAPGGPFLHWIIYNIPPNVTGLPQGLPAIPYIPGIGYQGINDFGKIGYGGPCPPPGPAHEYVIIIIALDKELLIGPGAPGHEVVNSINASDILGYGILIGYYG